MVKFINSLSFRVKLVAGLLVALIVLLTVILLRGGSLSPAEAMAKAGIEPPLTERTPLLQEAAWKPPIGADGFAEALSTDRYALLINPATTQIAVVEQSSGYRWTSNPTPEQLQEETVKGQLLTNLQSPFILTFVKTEGNDQTIRNVTNSLDPKVASELIRSEDKLQVDYFMESNNIGFSIQYELTDHGLKARIPSDGIREEGLFKVFSIELLPYFGADFDERIQTAEELSEPWEEAIKEGYSFKFLHLNGLKKLLALRFNKSDGVDYSQQDHKLVGIHLSSSEEILLHELIQGSWTVTKSSNFITITPKY